MAYTLAQLEALESAIASGALTVRYSDGKMVTYHSLAEMRNLRQEMQTELSVAPVKRRAKIIVPIAGKGL